MNDVLRGRLVGAFFALLFVVVSGSVGYYVIGEGRWSLVDCLYMTIITLTTVGFGEVLDGMSSMHEARGFTILLILFGMGTFVYFASTLTALIIEGDLREALRMTRMRKRIQKLEGHIIVCGVGSTGRHVIEELLTTEVPVVGVDLQKEPLEHLVAPGARGEFLFVEGDATDDEVLEAANLAGARGLVAALANDKDNLYLVVTARQANPKARIVARGSDLSVLEKLTKAGADTVVSPNYIGGMRMVSEMIRPEVVRFLDVMLRDKKGIRIEEVLIAEGSRYDGCSLAEARIREELGVAVLALRTRGSDDYAYNPRGGDALGAGMTLVVLGPIAKVRDLRERAGRA